MRPVGPPNLSRSARAHFDWAAARRATAMRPLRALQGRERGVWCCPSPPAFFAVLEARGLADCGRHRARPDRARAERSLGSSSSYAAFPQLRPIGVNLVRAHAAARATVRDGHARCTQDKHTYGLYWPGPGTSRAATVGCFRLDVPKLNPGTQPPLFSFNAWRHVQYTTSQRVTHACPPPHIHTQITSF